MGLCKCPKRKVTNQFCFEHRVNVCEHCMVTNHPKCVVQSYLQWLQDSDYNPVCGLCDNNLVNEECVRLTCYHVYHWPCLDRYARNLPANTAPAGYACPACGKGIFPPTNLVSPVADRLIAKLSEVNWARAGLGLPLVDEKLPVSSRSAPDGSTEESKPLSEPSMAKQGSSGVGDHHAPRKSPFSDLKPTSPLHPPTSDVFATSPPLHAPLPPVSNHSVLNVGTTAQYQTANIPYSSIVPALFSPKRMYDARDADHFGNASFDHDENKYRRRSAVEWFGRWFKAVTRPPNRRDPHYRMKRTAMIAILVFIAVLTLIIIMMRLGRANADADPFLDPLANPNIRVVDEVETR